MSEHSRLADAGTENEWTVVGGAKVVAHSGRHGRHPVVLVAVGHLKVAVALTPHQARALCEVLPSAADYADQEEA